MECCIIFCGMFCAEIHFSNIMDHALFFLHRQYKMNKKTWWSGADYQKLGSLFALQQRSDAERHEAAWGTNWSLGRSGIRRWEIGVCGLCCWSSVHRVWDKLYFGGLCQEQGPLERSALQPGNLCKKRLLEDWFIYIQQCDSFPCSGSDGFAGWEAVEGASRWRACHRLPFFFPQLAPTFVCRLWSRPDFCLWHQQRALTPGKCTVLSDAISLSLWVIFVCFPALSFSTALNPLDTSVFRDQKWTKLCFVFKGIPDQWKQIF